MPKLAAKIVKKVEKAEVSSGGFSALDPGKYVATLSKVTPTTSPNTGGSYWATEWTDVRDLDGNVQPGRQWHNVNLPLGTPKPPAGWKMNANAASKGKTEEEAWASSENFKAGQVKEFFQAFELTVDSDTDEAIGEDCVLVLGVETVQQGKNAGKQRNSVEALLPLSDVDYTEAEDPEADEF